MSEGVRVWPQRLDGVDATLWEIERDPTLHTAIVVVLRLAGPIQEARLLDTCEAATRILPKLRQRVVSLAAGVGAPYWVLDPNFDVADHVGFVTADGDLDAAIAEVAEQMASVPFPRTGSLWECTYIDAASGPTALVLKIHHCLTDGVGGVELLDVLLDPTAQTPPRDLDELPVPIAGAPLSTALAEALHAARTVARTPITLSRSLLASAIHPQKTLTDAARTLRSTGKLLAPVPNREPSTFRERGLDRDTARFEVDFARLHAAARRNHYTINDLFFAGVIGALGKYHQEQQLDIEQLRVVMPVSLRRPGDDAGGNRWAPARFDVPTGIADPVERIAAMHALVAESRKEPSLKFSKPLATALMTLPSAVSSTVVGSMMHGVDVVLTNVPGTSEPRFLAGVEVDRLWAFAPTSGAALNAALVSHGDNACVGILSDVAAIADPERLNELIVDELDIVLAAAEGVSTPNPAPASTARTPATVDDRPDRLSAFDTAFLRLESDETPLHVGGVAILDGRGLRDDHGRLKMDVIAPHIEARLQQLPRFSRRLVEVPFGLGRPIWTEDPEFDIDEHVLEIEVPGRGTRQDLLDCAASLIAEPLDRARPLWQVYLVDGLEDGSVGLVEKVHHCLVDGMSGVELAVALFDVDAHAAPDTPSERSSAAVPGQLRVLTDALLEQAVDPIRTSRELAATAWAVPEQIRSQAEAVRNTARDLISPGAIVRRASFNHHVGSRRELWTAVFDFDQVATTAREHNASINDVVLAAVSGALRRWMTRHGEPVFDVHAMVPVSLRDGGLESEPGNRVGGLLVALPVAEPDAMRRLQIVRDRTTRLKENHAGDGLGLLLDSFDHLPAPWSSLTARMVGWQRFANLIITNVGGPREPLYFLGSRIEEMIPVVPLAPNLGLGMAVLSYADRITIALSADPDQNSDADQLSAELRAELTALSGS